MGHFLETVLPVVAAVAATALFPGNAAWAAPLAAGAVKGGSTLAHGGSIGQALKSGAFTGGGTFLGGQIGSALGGGTAGAATGGATSSAGGPTAAAFGGPSLVDASSNLIGDTSGSALGNAGGSFLGKSVGSGVSDLLGPTAGNMLSDYLPGVAGASIGQAGGSFLGGQVGSDLGEPKPKGPTAWAPSQQPNQALPSSFSGISGLSPDQQMSNIATQGANGGIGPQETGYFLNQVNNKLARGDGNANGMSALSPIDNSFLQKLGLPIGNANDLLKAIGQWQTSNQAA